MSKMPDADQNDTFFQTSVHHILRMPDSVMVYRQCAYGQIACSYISDHELHVAYGLYAQVTEDDCDEDNVNALYFLEDYLDQIMFVGGDIKRHEATSEIWEYAHAMEYDHRLNRKRDGEKHDADTTAFTSN